jgi:predicted metal-binding protein
MPWTQDCDFDVQATLYVCETCRYSAEVPDHNGQRGGELLAEQLQRQLAREAGAGLILRRTRCLMACNRHCAVHLRAPGKIGYVIGDFEPSQSSADTLLDYIRKYQQSETGIVPYRTWPEGIKGHFIARVPPLDDGGNG